jgi:hypothetical protein
LELFADTLRLPEQKQRGLQTLFGIRAPTRPADKEWEAFWDDKRFFLENDIPKKDWLAFFPIPVDDSPEQHSKGQVPRPDWLFQPLRSISYSYTSFESHEPGFPQPEVQGATPDFFGLEEYSIACEVRLRVWGDFAERQDPNVITCSTDINLCHPAQISICATSRLIQRPVRAQDRTGPS